MQIVYEIYVAIKNPTALYRYMAPVAQSQPTDARATNLQDEIKSSPNWPIIEVERALALAKSLSFLYHAPTVRESYHGINLLATHYEPFLNCAIPISINHQNRFVHGGRRPKRTISTLSASNLRCADTEKKIDLAARNIVGLSPTRHRILPTVVKNHLCGRSIDHTLE